MKIAMYTRSNRLRENGYNLEQEKQIYNSNLEDIHDNPRWYLDNLEKLSEYRVSFIEYKPKKRQSL